MNRLLLALAAPAALGALALAACSEENEARLLDRPPTLAPFPRKARPFPWPDPPFALVSNNGSDSISVVDLRERKVLGTLPAGLDPVDLDGPHHLAFHRQRNEIFVALAYPAPAIAPGPHAAHGSSKRPGRVARIDVASGLISGEMRADNNPGDISLSDDGARLVVTHFDLQRAIANVSQGLDAQRASLLLYDPANFRPDNAPRSFQTCIAPHGIALSRPDGRWAYVACYGEDTLAVVDLASTTPETAVTRVPVGPAPGKGSALQYGPYATVLEPGGRRVLVGTTEGKDLRFFDTETGAMNDQRYSAGGAVFFAAVAPGGEVAYVPVQTPDFVARVSLSGQGELSELRRRSFSKEECQRPHEAVLRAGAGELLLVCEGVPPSPGALLILDPETLETRARLPMELYPDKVLVVEP